MWSQLTLFDLPSAWPSGAHRRPERVFPLKWAAIGAWSRDVQPTLEPAKRSCRAVQAAGSLNSRLALTPGPDPDSASSSLWGASSWRPGHPVAARGGPLWVNWRWPYPVRPGSLNSNAWSARQRPAASRHRLPPTLPRAPHGVPGQIDVRARLATHGSVDSGGAALAIETGADFAIGPKSGNLCRQVAALLRLIAASLPLPLQAEPPRGDEEPRRANPAWPLELDRPTGSTLYRW